MSKADNATGAASPAFNFLERLGSFGAEDISVDLGTSYVTLYVKKKKSVLREASVVAQRVQTGECIAFGAKAALMEGRTPQNIRIIRPIERANIVSYDAAVYLLKSLLNESYMRSLFYHLRLAICVPPEVTGLQRRALLEAAVQLDVRKTVLIEQPIAAVLGMGIDTDRIQGAMVCDVGGGSFHVSVLSKYSVIVADSAFEASRAMDQAIISAVRDQYRVEIGSGVAERVKEMLGASFFVSGIPEMADVAGISRTTGLPVHVTVTSEDVAAAIAPMLEVMHRKILTVLQKTPPTILADIRDHGILLCGGGSLLAGLDMLITKWTGIPAYVVENPMHVNAIGAGRALEYMDYLRDSMGELR